MNQWRTLLKAFADVMVWIGIAGAFAWILFHLGG